MSTNSGENWFQIDSALKAIDSWCNVSAFWIDPENTDRIYVGLHEHSQFPTSSYTSGGIYFTDNHGKSWMKIFDSYADKIKADNSTPRKLYFNTKYGLLVLKDTLVTDVTEQLQILPNQFELKQNYPNPFNPSTVISYVIKYAGLVKLKVYDILGSEVAELVNETKDTGYHLVEFNASNLPSGVYIYTLQVNSFSASQKMLLLK